MISTQAHIEPKDGDVYRFVYSQESREKARSGLGHGDLNWAFDGQLIVRDGRLYDTYWGLDWRGDTGRMFTVAEAQARGELHFVCNLNDVEKIQPEDYELYADGDAFNLSHQHGCYKYFVKRKGARKDPELMRAAVRKKVLAAHHELEWATRHLEWAIRREEQLLHRIEAGEEPSI